MSFLADDGEVFKVKKSSRSRRLMKQLDQERKRKKGEEKIQVDSDPSNMSNMQEKDLEIKTDDLVVSYLYDVLIILLLRPIAFSLLRRKKAKTHLLLLFI